MGNKIEFLRFKAASAPDPLPLPERMTPGSAGLDLQAAIRAPLTIAPGECARATTGFAVNIPEGFAGLVCPRSGVAWQYGLTVLNAPGIVDSDYRGPVDVLLVNLGRAHVKINRGDRIAQLVIVPVAMLEATEAQALDGTARAAGGFGSTGMA